MRKEKEILKIKCNDSQSLRTLVEAYYPEIKRYCMWHAPRSCDAEDAVQETFLKAIRFIGKESFRGNFRAFLYQIARNTCLDMAKSSWNKSEPFAEYSELLSDSADSIENVESRVDIESALLVLDEADRELIQLRFGQDLSFREIGEIMNIPMRTVQSRIRKALQLMKSEMKEK